MTAKRLSTAIKLLIIGTGLVCGIASARNYKDAIDPPLVVHPKDNCTRCHSDEKTIKAMNDKAAGIEVFIAPAK